MSLINEVLQDLDQRGRAGEPREPLQFATISGADQNSDKATVCHRGLRQDGRRFSLGMLVAATTLAGILIGFGLNAVGSPDKSGESQAQLPSLPATEPTSSLATETEVALLGASDQWESGAVGPTVVASKPGSTVDDASALSVAIESGPVPIASTESTSSESTSSDLTDPVLANATAGSTEKAPAGPEPADVSAAEPKFITLRNAVEPPRAAKASTPRQVTKSRVTRSHSIQPLVDAQRAIERGDSAFAEQLLQRHLGEVPGDRRARELLIGLMLRGERYPAAIEHLDQGLMHAPRHAKFALIKARLLAQSGDREGALRLLESLPQAHDGRVEAAQMLGALYQQQGRYADAVASYRELLGLKPKYGPAWVGYAISLDGTGDAAALAAYRRALRLGGVPVAAAQYAQKRIAQLEAGGE